MDKRVLLLVYPATLAVPAMFFFAMIMIASFFAVAGLPTGLNYIVMALLTFLCWPAFACLYVAAQWHWDPATVLPLYYFLTFIWLTCLGLPFVMRRRRHRSSPA